MDNNLPFHIKQFNDKVRTMNQTNGKVITLNTQEARSLHAEIFDLMATISNLAKNTGNADNNITVSLNGGTFK
jgi:hypothetical protein